MLFEVKKNGVAKMSTTQTECIKDPATLRDMQRAGYDFFVDGKKVTIRQIGELINGK